MQEEFGYSSTNSIFQHLNALEKKNYLTKKGRGNYDIHPSKRNQLSRFYPGIPVKGRIAAGGMHQAISENLGHLPVEIHPSKSDHYFALIVDGESMIDADIRDGDYIIIDPRPPKDGEIGAILYNGETTLKTIRKKSAGVLLQPENPSYEPISITPDEWEEITVFGRESMEEQRQLGTNLPVRITRSTGFPRPLLSRQRASDRQTHTAGSR